MDLKAKVICYLSLVPLERRKAYAVTTVQTALALRKLGFELRYFGPFSKSRTATLWPFDRRKKISNIILSINLIMFRFTFLAKLSFVLQRKLLQSRLLVEQNLSESNLLWTRDLRVAITYANRGFAVCCEVHAALTHRELVALEKLSSRNKLWLFPISISLKDELLSLSNLREVGISLLPMGADKAFFEAPSVSHSYSPHEHIRIGYIGSYETVGITAGLEDVISSLFLQNDFQIEFLVVGVGKGGATALNEHFAKIQSSKKTQNFSMTLLEWVNHDDVLGYIQSCHMVILPYQENSFNSGRFPIKAIEYSASQIPILCSDTVSHRNIFNENQVYFYKDYKYY